MSSWSVGHFDLNMELLCAQLAVTMPAQPPSIHEDQLIKTFHYLLALLPALVLLFCSCATEESNIDIGRLPTSVSESETVSKKGAESSSVFERPVRISVADAPLNAVAKKRYPSPAMFDVDGDGKAELVIGDLMGNLGYYENLNTSGIGDPVWDSREELQGISGKPIRTPNW